MYRAPDREVNLQHPKAGAGPLPPTFRSPIGFDSDLARSHQVPSPPALCILLSAFQVLPPPPSEMPGLAPAATSTSDNLRLCTKDVYRARARALGSCSRLLPHLLCSALSLTLATNCCIAFGYFAFHELGIFLHATRHTIRPHRCRLLAWSPSEPRS
ncbi:hypothetical protein V8C26DRAFT_386972 [Trichoderma gracile]